MFLQPGPAGPSLASRHIFRPLCRGPTRRAAQPGTMPAQPDLQWMMSMPKATPSQPLTPAQTRALRALGHRLRPVVTVSERGLTEGVSAELERALEDHELIKRSEEHTSESSHV